ncbi:hypothetical protein DI392_01940 [Vibrio albus]|uniref:Chondroitin AC lyase n=1 Tax=Vibrio albus TaxID=2200953 RepID=A0A2U3BE77_9VIBR|nr:polysaccharide lyase family 8 super-sandwich domain-containing protein [Vibrio albus]PWI35062.1 hypothetical protein DI392_01940 [Vibrio albus]
MKRFKYSILAVSLAAVTGCTSTMQISAPSAVSSGQAVKQATKADFETLKARVVPDFVASSKAQAKKKNMTLKVLAADYLKTLSPEGAWPDINYQQVEKPGWSPRGHLDRLVILAAAYNESPDVALGNAISNALIYWLDADPQSWNWWWHDIGIPKRIGYSAVMAKEALNEELLKKVADYLPSIPNYSPTNPNSPIPKAANRTDIALAVLNRGLLTDDSDMVGKAIADIEATVGVSTGAGIQHDYSFHQHGPQLYTSGYGPVWFSAAAKWADLVNDLPWAFAPEKMDILVSYLLDGQRWSKRHGQWDYNTMSRGISRTKRTEYMPQSSGDMPEHTPMDIVAGWMPERADDAQAFKAHEFGDAGAGLNGFKHFWRSDYSVKSSDGHMFSIGMNSQRVEPAEAGNGENLKGFWLGFGSTFLMQRGNEYYNIFPVWNWALVPGVTAPEYVGKGADWGRIMQPDVSFVGGVSNERYGVSMMDLDIAINHAEGAHSTKPGFYQCGEGKGHTEAKKAWFSFADEVVALGTGIKSTNCESVNTSLNQTRLNGEVTVDGSVAAMGSRDLTDAKWVHHDGVGYVFPQSWKGTLSNQTQTGTWKALRKSSSDELVSQNVFTLSMTHGVNPDNATYQYVIAPGKTADQVDSYSKDLPVKVLKNTPEVQAVHHKGLNVTGIVFYQAGSVKLNSDLTVTVDKPSVILLDDSVSQPTISVSTPGVEFADVTLGLQSVSHGNLTHSILTPGGEADLGRSVTFDWDKGPDNREWEAALKAQQQAQLQAAQQPELTLLAVADTELQGGQYADRNFDIVSRWDLWAGQITDGDAAEAGVTKEVKSVIKFDLTQLSSAGAEKAVLKLHVRNIGGQSPQTVQVAALADSHWSEAGVTWNNLPAVKSESIPWTVSSEQKKQWVELDVTKLVNEAQSSGAISLLLSNKGSGFVAFGSDETDQIPELVVKRAL